MGMKFVKTAKTLRYIFMLIAVFFIFCVKSYAALGVDWYAATLNAAFPGKHQPGGLVYNGMMWTIGGTNSASVHTNDVWNSADGANWTLVNPSAAFAGRNSFVFLNYNNRMWISGGSSNGVRRNDTWWSTDGITWTCTNPSGAYEVREATTGVTFDNGTGEKMWVIGGFNGSVTFFNDAWYSTDGVTWNAATRNAAFEPVRSHTCLNFNGKIWLIGGTKQSLQVSKEVWWSSNGSDWYPATLNAAFGQIAQQASVVFDNKMWVIGGMNQSGTKLNDVWWSSDGIDWFLATGNAAFGGLDTEAAVVFNNRMWTISGYSLRKEVWYSELPPTPTPTQTMSPAGTATPPLPCGITGTDWFAATLNASFSPRHQAAALTFNNKIWLIAGADILTHFSDVWSSDDGINWTQATAAAAFGARAGHTAVVFNDGTGDKMWVIGGSQSGTLKNDVWWSIDGATWNLATSNAGFTPRWGLKAVVYNNRIWVTGGNDGSEKNDVWSSADGTTWVQATAGAAFSQRSYPQFLTYNDGSGNKMWVMTGFDGVNKLNDVWWSTDGVVWNLSTAAAAFPPRYTASALTYDNKMWIIGGFGTSARLNDAWWSTDGIIWNNATYSAAFSERESIACVVFNDKMWLMGGLREAGLQVANDVWYSCGPVNTPTLTQTVTGTATRTFTATLTLTIGGTATETSTATNTPTVTKTFTVTYSPTLNYTASCTPTMSRTHTMTPTVTVSPTITITPTPYPDGDIVVYPNPFNPDTAVGGNLKFLYVKPGSTARIFSLTGEYVAAVNTNTNCIEWDGRNLADSRVSPGIYYYLVEDSKRAITAKGKLFIVRR
jgi:hypothetical protein